MTACLARIQYWLQVHLTNAQGEPTVRRGETSPEQSCCKLRRARVVALQMEGAQSHDTIRETVFTGRGLLQSAEALPSSVVRWVW